ncbi:MAG TPA: subclass B3 metallo-beta-lactamase, partial [Terriglobia bacterium]|nr:subclass B3 metallo-beta-lactamase [Terriglobia bacterium]
MNRLVVAVFIVALCPIAAFSQAAPPAGWNDPFPAHKVMDNFYFVGTKELASFLIVTPQGHILMNSNYESSVPLIQANVEKLGFKFSDIKILIAGHAHPDHVEGDAMV